MKAFKKRTFLSVGIVLAVLIFNVFGIGSFVRQIFGGVLIPLTSTGTFIGYRLSEFGGNVKRIRTINQKYSSLEQEVGVLRTRVSQYDLLRQQNDRLRDDLNLLPRKKFQLLGADVIGHDLHGGGEWILINRGKDAGVAIGMHVIVGDNVLVGFVDEIFEKNARIRLITHTKTALSVIHPGTGTKIFAEGDHGLGIVARDIPKEVTIDVGTTLLLNNYNEEFSQEKIGVGVVREVRETKDRLAQDAYLEPTL